MLSDILFQIAYKIEEFIDDYILELFVGFPSLENRIRSHRLSEEDVRIMSSRGYYFDGDAQRWKKSTDGFTGMRFSAGGSIGGGERTQRDDLDKMIKELAKDRDRLRQPKPMVIN